MKVVQCLFKGCSRLLFMACSRHVCSWLLRGCSRHCLRRLWLCLTVFDRCWPKFGQHGKQATTLGARRAAGKLGLAVPLSFDSCLPVRRRRCRQDLLDFIPLSAYMIVWPKRAFPPRAPSCGLPRLARAPPKVKECGPDYVMTTVAPAAQSFAPSCARDELAMSRSRRAGGDICVRHRSIPGVRNLLCDDHGWADMAMFLGIFFVWLCLGRSPNEFCSNVRHLRPLRANGW